MSDPINTITPHLVPLRIFVSGEEETIWHLPFSIGAPKNYEDPINETP